MNRPANIALWSAIWIGLAAWAYVGWYQPGQQTKATQQQQRTDAVERKARGPYVASEKEIAPGQTIRMVVMPHSSGMDFLDTKCFVYTHQEFKQASMVCPDAKQADIEVDEKP